MSSYYDDETPRRRSHRKSRPVYEEEIIERRSTKPKDSGQMQLVRRRDSEDSVEEVRRDFPPGDGTYIQRRTTTRDRYGHRRRSADYDYDDADQYESRRSGPRRSSHRNGKDNCHSALKYLTLLQKDVTRPKANLNRQVHHVGANHWVNKP